MFDKKDTIVLLLLLLLLLAFKTGIRLPGYVSANPERPAVKGEGGNSPLSVQPPPLETKRSIVKPLELRRPPATPWRKEGLIARFGDPFPRSESKRLPDYHYPWTYLGHHELPLPTYDYYGWYRRCHGKEDPEGRSWRDVFWAAWSILPGDLYFPAGGGYVEDETPLVPPETTDILADPPPATPPKRPLDPDPPEEFLESPPPHPVMIPEPACLSLLALGGALLLRRSRHTEANVFA